MFAKFTYKVFNQLNLVPIILFHDVLYGLITIKNKHNHSIDFTAENTFFECFNDNMGITEAIKCHKSILEQKENF